MPHALYGAGRYERPGQFEIGHIVLQPGRLLASGRVS
jgi:hypothetical protein